MSLTQETIVKNAKTFFKTGEKYGFVNDEFIEKYGEKITSAPYSKTTEGPNCFEGGLIDHIIRMTAKAIQINDNLSEDRRVNKESLIKVCFLHQIGKANMFVKNNSDWHIERGLLYEFNDNDVALKVAEKSLKYVTVCGIELTEDEYDAIALYGSEFANRPLKTEGERIATIIKSANLIAIIEEK